ncbi:MAG: HNH endonuclease [Bacteroidetes bacterium]|nr:HNH endonuclease [Bacteroidota bacterium]
MSQIINITAALYEFKEERKHQADPIKYQINTNGCHICVSHALDKDGYPRVYRHNKNWRMSRYVWSQFNNREIPEGYLVMHTCDNPNCINPNHLRLGTHRDNMLDRQLKGRTLRGNQNGNSKLFEEQVYYIKFLSTESVKELATKYDVSQDAIRDIRKGITWDWMKEDYITRNSVA